MIDNQNAESVEGEYTIETPNRKYKVDGVIRFHLKNENILVLLEFHGCFWHGCLKCYPPDHINAVNKKDMYTLRNNTHIKDRFLKSYQVEGYKVMFVKIWECDWKEIKNNNLFDYLKSLFEFI